MISIYILPKVRYNVKCEQGIKGVEQIERSGTAGFKLIFSL